MKISFTVLGECVSMKNSRQIVSGRDGRPRSIKSKEALEYEKNAVKQIPPECKQMIESAVAITYRMFYASERKDMDEALLQDCLQARYKKAKGKLIRVAPGEYVHEKSMRVLVQKGVIVNDRQVKERHVYWALDKINPRVEVELETLEAMQCMIDLDVAEDECVE